VKFDPAQVKEERDRLTARITGKDNAGPILNEVRRRMWDCVSVVRREESLKETLEVLLRIKKEVVPRLEAKDFQGLLRVLFTETAVRLGSLVTLSALLRRESRGTHYREDFPRTDHQRWNQMIRIRKDGEQTLASLMDPVEIDDFDEREEVLFHG